MPVFCLRPILLLSTLSVVLLCASAADDSNSSNSEVVAESWIDAQTPDDARTTVGMDGRTLSLVFSDEFEDSLREFKDGSDTRWTSEDRPGTTNEALHYYNSSHVYTSNGKLVIEATRKDANYTEHDPNGWLQNFHRDYQTGMVTTWNKFCFTSGMIEIRFQLPGKATRGGLWPAFWMLGNLARPSYLKSSDGMWPWSYNECGGSGEARVARDAQELDKCVNPVGRGSPEIDIIEAQPGDFNLQYTDIEFTDGTFRNFTLGRPMIASSLQVSPGVDETIRPESPFLPEQDQWYSELYPMGGPAYGNMDNTTTVRRMLNNYWYGQLIDENGAWQDGLSVNWQHSEDYYTSLTTLRTEWQVGEDDGYVKWYVGDELIFQVTSDTLKSKPGARDSYAQIPYEAMYLILNTDISPRWGWNGCNPSDPCVIANPGFCVDGELTCFDCSDPKCLICPDQTGWLADFCEDVDPAKPAQYLIDYVRVYQDANDATHHVGCSPPDLPTKEFIEAHKERYIFDTFVQSEPLTPIKHGGGTCVIDADCGNYEAPASESRTTGSTLNDFPKRSSECVSGYCVCPDLEWTGPHCHSPCVGEYAICVPHSGSPRTRFGMAAASSGTGFLTIAFSVFVMVGWGTIL